MQSPETEDRWYVEIRGSVQMMTLDELVEAYEAGTISAKTLVTEVGASEWHTLAEVADLPEEEEAGPQSLASPAVAAAAASFVPAPRTSAAPSYAPPSSRESAWPPDSAWPPVAVVSRAPVAPASVAPSRGSNAAPSFAPNSTVPVVQDLDFGSLDMPFKRSKGKTAFVALAVVAVLGAAGFGATRAGLGKTAAVPVPAAPLAGPSPASLGDWKTPTTPVAAAPAAPTPAPAETAAADKAAADARLTDDVKTALLAKDKDHEAKKKAVRSGHGARSTARKSSSSSSVFRSGGNANDPLNSKL